MTMGPDVDHHGIVVRPVARALMAAHRPVVWLVFEDVALDAGWRDGRLVAATSARLVAEHLGIDPGTAASALRVLRDAGIVELGQTSGPDGRFGLAAYTVHLPDGVERIAPQPVPPRADVPHAVLPEAGVGLVLTCPWEGQPPLSPARKGAKTRDAVAPQPGTARTAAKPRRKAAGRPAEQGAFDLGAGL